MKRPSFSLRGNFLDLSRSEGEPERQEYPSFPGVPSLAGYLASSVLLRCRAGELSGHPSLPSTWPPWAVRSLCDFKHSQTELYLDTRARASFWGGGGGRALQRGPRGLLVQWDSRCVRGQSHYTPTGSPTRERKGQLPFAPGGSQAGFICSWKNKSRSGWSVLRLGQAEGRSLGAPSVSSCSVGLSSLPSSSVGT